ncbi:MAG: 4-hydroxybenzoate octaprenyltransferase [Devosia sp.]|uniref:4-hydroxybenzoate octaprenyltransferase n=1 Tax=Devosia sp. TaxID=1871048 RepID=UPI001AD5697F|nr:4-hydroxybenzoate octaprenyltransferase [Devosia sp.]MBN9316939.1 4-hydroxybenzoate octaprenyltransferase [Devosia sp.]
MQTPEKATGTVADAERGNWVDRYAPDWLKPYARLARWDRPIPLLLLFWPCAFGLALATLDEPSRGFDVMALVLFLIGSVVMRGAGCTFNDIVDTDIDMKVARTRSRPIPSGQVSKRQAALFLIAQCLAGLAVLVQFNGTTVLLGVSSLVLVAIYPFMKRVTWWPQFFLGLAFNWGALIGWTAATGSLALPPLLLYAGSILWTIGYDTIYALQDMEDDALIGVRSTARLFGRRARLFIALFYAGTALLWVAAGLAAGARWPFLAAMLVPIGIFAWQIRTLDPRDPGNALVRFRANHWVGLSLALAILVGLM